MAREKKKDNKRRAPQPIQNEFNPEKWSPKTELGSRVKKGEIVSIDQIIDRGLPILEPEIVDALLPNLEVELLEVGQSKGKFGGGKRSIWRQTQKKSKEGNKPSFSTVAVVGNGNGYVGIGFGKAKETVPAREKAIRKAKLNIIKIKRGCGSWVCGCGAAHSIPFKVSGKWTSVHIELLPAPKGTSLCAEKECQKILKLAGFKDIYANARGQTKTKLNLIYACFKALQEISAVKVKEEFVVSAGIVGGRNE
jgi:small subunit ribosomal protein S5